MKSCTIEVEIALRATLVLFPVWRIVAVMDVIKVSGSSRTSAVAGAIAGVFREHQHADIQAIGAGAVNQAVKALVLARGYLAEDGYEVVCLPEFADVEIDGKVRTAIKLVVELRESAHKVDVADEDYPEDEASAVEMDEAGEVDADEESEGGEGNEDSFGF